MRKYSFVFISISKFSEKKMSDNKFSNCKEPSFPSLVIFTLLSAIVCMMVGYVFVPIAAGMYSALLVAEKRGRFFFSYIIPVITVALNFFLNGFYSLEGISFAIVGFVLYLLYQKNKTKNETAFWITSIILLLFALSGVLLAFEDTGIKKPLPPW